MNPLTEDPIGAVQPKKKILRGMLIFLFFFGVGLIALFIFTPGPRDFLRSAQSIFSRSLSDTFSSHQFGKLAVEVDLKSENFSAMEQSSGLQKPVSDSQGGNKDISGPVLEKRSPKPKEEEPKVEKSSEEAKSGAANIPPSQLPVIFSGAGSESGARATSSDISVSKNILIAEVQIAGASTTNDFVKIYNSENFIMDIGGWKLKKKTNSGTEYSVRVFPAGSAIQSRGYFIWANSAGGFSATVGANVSSTQTLSADNSITLFDSNNTRGDALAWGSSTLPYVEGAPYPKNPGENKILSRKFFGGEMQDTNNNSADFEIR